MARTEKRLTGQYWDMDQVQSGPVEWYTAVETCRLGCMHTVRTAGESMAVLSEGSLSAMPLAG